jgi:hypothetical protein
MATSTGRTTVSIPVELHRRVFGEGGMKPYDSMSNAEFIEEMAETYVRVKDI